MIQKTILLHAFFTPIVVISLVLIILALLFSKVFLCVFRKQSTRKALTEALLFALVSACFVVPELQTLRFCIFLPFEEASSIGSGSGLVTSVEPCLYHTKYYKGEGNDSSRAYIITVDGTEYFCLDADSVACGDMIKFSFYPKSKVIVSFILQNEALPSARTEIKGRSINTHSDLPYKELLLCAEMYFLCSTIGLLVALPSKHNSKTEGAVWIKGEFLYGNGAVLIPAVFVLSLILGSFVPALKKLNYIVILLPTIILVVARDIPLSFAISDTVLSKYFFGTICLREVNLSDIRKVTLFESRTGNLIAVELRDADLLQCKTLLSFIGYGLRNRKKLMLLPISKGSEDYAEQILASQLNREIYRTKVRATGRS